MTKFLIAASLSLNWSMNVRKQSLHPTPMIDELPNMECREVLISLEKDRMSFRKVCFEESSSLPVMTLLFMQTPNASSYRTSWPVSFAFLLRHY